MLIIDKSCNSLLTSRLHRATVRLGIDKVPYRDPLNSSEVYVKHDSYERQGAVNPAFDYEPGRYNRY